MRYMHVNGECCRFLPQITDVAMTQQSDERERGSTKNLRRRLLRLLYCSGDKDLSIEPSVPFAAMRSVKLIGFIAAMPSTLALVQRQYVLTVSGAASSGSEDAQVSLVSAIIGGIMVSES